MTNPFTDAGLQFLADLAENNSRDWFQANQQRYERDLKGPARALVAAVNDELASFAPEYVTPPGKAINRINRDIRFSKDKTPYNTRVWAGFMNQGAPKAASAGLFFGFSPVDAGVGAGVWMPPREALESLRAHFAAHYEDYWAIVRAPDFASTFREGASDALKRVPKPYATDHPAAELLKLKGIHVMADLDPALITAPDLPQIVAAHFKKLLPLVRFVDAGLGA